MIVYMQQIDLLIASIGQVKQEAIGFDDVGPGAGDLREPLPADERHYCVEADDHVQEVR